MTRKLRSLILVAVLAMLGTGLLATPAHGGTITVDTLEDDGYLNPVGDPEPTDGKCSLREAIAAANNDVEVDSCPAGNGADTIVLDTGMYILSENDPALEEDLNRRGDLDIGPIDAGLPIPEELDTRTAAQPIEPPDLTIEGNGSTVDGTLLQHCNIFHIHGVSVLINSLTITGAGPVTPPPRGGGFLVEGGSLVLNNSTVRNNIADEGAGIYNDGGHVEILDGSVIGPGNDSNFDGGGIWTGQGPQTLIVQDSTIEGNDAGVSGGGIYNASDSVTIERSTIADNAALDGDGGGIWTSGSGLVVTNSTISDNAAEDLPVENGSGEGGGIYLAAGGRFELHFVTVANNTAEVEGGNIGIGNVAVGTGALDNTIVAGGKVGELAQNCSIDGGSDIESFGFNLSDLSQDADGAAATSCRLDGASDITGQNPQLGDLQSNGGPTETHALRPRSPAIDSAGLTCVATDQRGISRPQDGDGTGGAACDRGAFEVEGTGPPEPHQKPPPPPPPPPVCDITGTAGPDILVGTEAGESICGLQGDDIIRGGGGNDSLFGAEGDDLLEGGLGDDEFVGGPGSDTGDYSNAPGSVDADLARGSTVGVGASTDTLAELENLIGSSFPDRLAGDAGPNELVGRGGADLMLGRGEDDILRGNRGNDYERGGRGDDLVKGGFDNDRLLGGNGDDRQTGGQQEDRVIGNKGDDSLRGGGADDHLDGKADTDRCDGGYGTNVIVNCEE
jgi:CSLREA domain-containing protein